MKKDNLKPGFNGLPVIKKQYEKNEKTLIVEAAEKYGVQAVIDAYGLKSRTFFGWQRYYGGGAAKSNASKNEIKLIIQSPAGQEITTEEIIKKVGEADTIYIRVDENAAYWVKGEENGSVNLW